MTKKRPVSPESTGGAGTIFEYRVGAYMLTHLLARTHPPGMALPALEVAWQQRPAGSLLDDIVVYGEDTPTGLCTEYQVKRTLTVTASDKEFVEALTQILHTLHERRDAVERGELALGLITAGAAAPVDQLKRLADYADAHRSHRSLDEVFVEGITDRGLRNRLTQVRLAVKRAISKGAPDLGGVERTTHAVLADLHVWRVEDADHQHALDRLTPTAEMFGKTSGDLLAHLAEMTQIWGPLAGRVDAPKVRRRLRHRGLKQRQEEGHPEADPADADAVVRGPMESLGLQERFEEARRQLACDDPSAVSLFHQIADTLQEKGYAPHAAMVRRHEAEALHRHGDETAAVHTRVALVWDHLDKVQPWEAGFALSATHPGSPAVSPGSTRIVQVARAGMHVAKGSAIISLVESFDALAFDDLFRDRAAAFLCEYAIALEQPHLILQRQTVLEDIASTPSEAGLRVLMCLADVTGQWRPCLQQVQRRFPRPMVAWTHARYGRHLAMIGDGAGAQEAYLSAIERACGEKMFDEAATWLYAWRYVRFWYQDFDGNDQQHHMAQALRPHALPSRLPGSPHTLEQALRVMHDERRPGEALQRVRLWLWQCVVRADLNGQSEAASAMGTLLNRSGRHQEAISWFIRAGEDKLAAAAADELTSAPTGLETAPAMPAAEVCQAAAFAAVAAAADLIDDTSALAWADTALAHLASLALDQHADDGNAMHVLAVLCPILPASQAHQLLAIVEPLIERSPADLYDSIAAVLVGLAQRFPQAAAPMARALLTHERMAAVIMAHPALLAEHRDTISPLLSPAASHNPSACVALILAGADPSPVIVLARRRVTQELRPQDDHMQGSAVRAGVAETAILASVLEPEIRADFARLMLTRAGECHEVTSNRRGALNGLATIAKSLDASTRTNLLPQVLELAQGKGRGGPTDGIDARTQMPFSAAALRARSGTVTDVALLAAAHLASELDDCQKIERTGLALLRDAESSAQLRIARALTMLPATGSSLDLETYAVHPLAVLRAVAAIRWAQRPDLLAAERVEALAHDDDRLVRHNLASAVRDNFETIPTDARRGIVEILSSDTHRSVRQLVAELT